LVKFGVKDNRILKIPEKYRCAYLNL
jgi:hypothetical protein